MSNYLDPKIDLLFRRVFGEHKPLIIDLLNALLPLEVPIASVTYLPRDQIPPLPTQEKYTIVDVKCHDELGRIFVVEMQMNWCRWEDQRVLFYAAQSFTSQLPKREDYGYLQPVYALAIINDYFDKESPNYYHHYKIANQDEPHKIIEGLEFIFIELPKFNRDCPDPRFSKKLRKAHVLWLRFLKEIGEDKPQPDDQLLKYQPISEALKLVEEASLTKGQRAAYEETWKRISYARTIQGEQDRAVANEHLKTLISSLLLVLRARFHTVPLDIENRLQHASSLELTNWLGRAATAPSISEVFDA